MAPGEGGPPASVPGAVAAPAVGEAEVADSDGLFSGWAGAEGCTGAALGGGFVPGAVVLGGMSIGVLLCCSMIRRE